MPYKKTLGKSRLEDLWEKVNHDYIAKDSNGKPIEIELARKKRITEWT